MFSFIVTGFASSMFLYDELNINAYKSPAILCDKDGDKCTINIRE